MTKAIWQKPAVFSILVALIVLAAMNGAFAGTMGNGAFVGAGQLPPGAGTATPGKKRVVCVDPSRKKKCKKSITGGVKAARSGGIVVVSPDHDFKENLEIKKAIVICVGDTSKATQKANKANGLAPFRCFPRSTITAGGTTPTTVFKLTPKSPNDPCVVINPPFDAEVTIIGMHVYAGKQHRAGECVWHKSGAFKLLWSDLLGDNTGVGMLALTGKSAHVEGTVVHGGQNGIKVFPPQPGTFVLLQNEISHATTGLRVQGGSTVYGVGNKIFKNDGDGVTGLEGDGFYSRNAIYENRGAGIRLDRDRLTHSFDRTTADVIGNTLDWNHRGEMRVENGAVAGSAGNCIVVHNKRDYKKHVRQYKKQKRNKQTKPMREYSDHTKNGGELYAPQSNVYWLESWSKGQGVFPDAQICKSVKGRKWQRLCFDYVQHCRPQ